MKTTCWLILGTMMAAGAVAQNNTNALPPIPAPVTSPAAEAAPAPAAVETNAPPAKHAVKHRKHAAAAKRKISAAEPSVALVPGPAEVAVSNLLVRGQASLKGEVVAHLFKGDAVTVLEQINLERHKADEPGQWAKIALPAGAHVWVRSLFIDETNKTVLPKKLNLRAGPGENFSVLGVVERGAPVNVTKTRGNWVQIDPPANSYAFVAAMYLKQEPAAAPAPAPVPAPEAEPTPVPEPQPIVTTPPPPAEPTPPPLRIVEHEGVVTAVDSVVAPTKYKLYDPDTMQDIDYLFTTSPSLDLSRYVNMRIIVTGEEGIDKRWPNTPVIAIQRINVISTNAVPKVKFTSPRASQGR